MKTRCAESGKYWDTKKKVRLWFTAAANPLKLSEIVIYAYRAYQDEYDETPNLLKVCKATGLSKDAISGADAQLYKHGLIESDRTVKRPPEGWFYAKRPETIKKLKAEGRHWRHYFTTWDLFVRNPQTAQDKITFTQAALLSYLWHCFGTNFEPQRGWSISYLAKVLRCRWQTVKDGLMILEYHEAIKHSVIAGEGLKIKLCLPTEEITRLFQDAEKPRQYQRQDCSIVVYSHEPPPTWDDVLKKVIKTTGYEGEEAEDMAHKIMEIDNFDVMGGQLLLDMYYMSPLPLHTRRSRVEALVREEGYQASA